MTSYRPSPLPYLPLLLWGTPPGLDLALAQEGIPFQKVREPHPLAFQGGRFVLYDGRRIARSALRARLSPDHIAIDIDKLRDGQPVDPFRALVDLRAAYHSWNSGGFDLTERVSRFPKAAIRERLIAKLRHSVNAAGGVWARLATFPFPYQSAFNLRADLDEAAVDDYARFARARKPLEDCCTHFVSTHAYGNKPAVLQDLHRFDTQSHGHYHVIYRDPNANRRNLLRAHTLLRDSGFEPNGFAAPHGRWNPGLDSVLETLGYSYSSDFQLGYDDLPFFPWLGDRYSKVLQVPIHPISEGLFFDAGASRGRIVADHLVQTVRARIDAGEPAFVYGHPERRLGRYPEILAALADAIEGEPLLWRVTLTEFAAWWRYRASRRWSLLAKSEPERRLEVQFDDWSPDFPLALEVIRGPHVSTIPLNNPLTPFRADELTYSRRDPRIDHFAPRIVPRPHHLSLKSAVRQAIDWETVTPLDDLPAQSLADRVKKGLRWWRSRTQGAA